MGVAKVSSFGHGKQSDIDNTGYTGRFDTLEDETGRHIDKKDIVAAVTARLSCVTSEKTSFRVIHSLPKIDTQEALWIVQDEARQRYGTFLSAFHPTNDKGEVQPHIHLLVFNDMEHHPLRRLTEIFDFRNSIDRRFKDAGISYSPSKHPTRAKRTQSEIHIIEKSRHSWKEDMRKVLKDIVRNSAVRNFRDFENELNSHGISIVRRTEKTLTLMNKDGKRVRLTKLFSGARNQEDIESLLNQWHKVRQQRALAISEGIRRKNQLPMGSKDRLIIHGQDHVNKSSEEEIEDYMQAWEKELIAHRRQLKRSQQHVNRGILPSWTPSR